MKSARGLLAGAVFGVLLFTGCGGPNTAGLRSRAFDDLQTQTARLRAAVNAFDRTAANTELARLLKAASIWEDRGALEPAELSRITQAAQRVLAALPSLRLPAPTPSPSEENRERGKGKGKGDDHEEKDG